MNNNLIIRLQDKDSLQQSKESVKINKRLSSISPSDFIKLLSKADNKVNPRSARVNKITKSIHETLEMSPELFWLKSKGILIATENCRSLDRNRVELSLNNIEYEGIMDGGHNTFAIATFFIEKFFDKKLKNWSECKAFWSDNYEEIIKKFEENAEEIAGFSIPIEIVFPNDEEGSIDDYYNYIAEICSARNNNVQLTETSKGNKVGFYDELKKSLDTDFDIIWKSGNSGTIKSEDVISMATLPLLFLQENDLLPKKGIKHLSPVSIYSQKSKCIEYFNSILSHKDISFSDKGKYNLKDSYVSSGLNLVKDIMIFFDKLFVEFPTLYNKVSPGFGRIKAVNDKKSRNSLFRTGVCKNTYPPGFVYPIITGVMELMQIDSSTKTIRWRKSPTLIDLYELDVEQYIDAIKLANYDPQTVGKQVLFYRQARSIFANYLLKSNSLL